MFLLMEQRADLLSVQDNKHHVSVHVRAWAGLHAGPVRYWGSPNSRLLTCEAAHGAYSVHPALFSWPGGNSGSGSHPDCRSCCSGQSLDSDTGAAYLLPASVRLRRLTRRLPSQNLHTS